MGLSVLLVGDGPEKKWKLSSNGQVIDPEPNFAVTVGHPEHRLGLAGNCLKTLRFMESDWSSVIVEDPSFQAITPRFRAGFHENVDATLRSALRETGPQDSVIRGLVDALRAATPPLLKFWETLPERLTLPVQEPFSSEDRSASSKKVARKPVSEVADEFQFRKELRRELPQDPLAHAWGETSAELRMLGASESEKEWVDAWLAGALGSEVPLQMAPFDVLQALAVSLAAVRFRGGMSAFRALLLRMLVRLGTHVVDAPVGVNRLFVEEGKILGVQLSGAENTRNVTRARGVLSSIHPERIRSWIEGAELRRPPVSMETELLRVTLAITVPKAGIPMGLSRRVVWKESGAPALEIERAIPGEYGFPLEGREYLFIRSCFPMEAQDWSIDRWRAVCERMFRQAGEILPFLEDHVERIFPDFRGPEFGSHWEEFYGAGKLSSSDLFRVPVSPAPKTALPRVEGLFHSHRLVAPALGAMGEWSEALNATAWIAHRSGLAGPLG
jgi:hypothetical protein